MRPMKLIMNAFGPYSGLQEIDFRSLKGENIFLITGPTGSGKTTIFDAISFALFGEASGSSRENESLRSDFAKDDELTYVELEFELRNENYIIKRSPAGLRKKAKGEGFTKKNSDAEIILPSGKKIVGVKDVDNKITEILGITKQQFKQIVMLPQGEFRKLLEAESKEREGIFRKIFGTQIFENIKKKLESKSKELYIKVKDNDIRINANIGNIDCNDNDILKELVESDSKNIDEILNNLKEYVKLDGEKLKELDKEEATLREKERQIQKELSISEEKNKNIDYRENIKLELKEKNEEKDSIKSLQNEVELNKKAIKLGVIQNILNQKINSISQKEAILEESIIAFKKSCDILVQKENSLNSLKDIEIEKNKLIEDISRLKGYEDSVRNYENKSNEIKLLESKLTRLENEIAKFKIDIAMSKKQKEEREEAFKNILESEVILVQKTKEKESILNDIEKLRIYYKDSNNLKLNIRKNEKDKKEFSLVEESYKRLKAKFESMDELFKKGQAGLLASNLVEGIKCPVCGSKNHPSKAELLEGVPSEEELKAIKVKFKKEEDKYNNALLELKNQKSWIEENKERLIDVEIGMKTLLEESFFETSDFDLKLNIVKILGTKLGGKMKVLDDEIQNIAKIKNTREIVSREILALNKNIEDLTRKSDKSIEDSKELYGILNSQKKEKTLIEEQIPNELRKIDLLLSKIQKLQERLTEIKSLEDSIRVQYMDAKSKKSKYESEVKLNEANLLEAKDDMIKTKNQFNDEIKLSGFSDIDSFKKYLIKEESILVKERKIKEYYETLKSLEDRYDEIIRKIGDQKKIDLEVFKEKLELILKDIEVVSGEQKLKRSKIDNNTKAYKNIKKIYSDMLEYRKEYSVIGELWKVAAGDNKERLSFETYVLAAYFNEIIHYANLRLSKMTQGRFLLKRKEEKGKGLKQQGLELEVFDNYTGKSRHVKTLSGGEGFKSSLALALGLTDVVQNYAGGISLDTMFVDEGFGTLDPESLDSAIECLINLQSGGRLVGIISHVPELKERIQKRLIVTPTKTGSVAEFSL